MTAPETLNHLRDCTDTFPFHRYIPHSMVSYLLRATYSCTSHNLFGLSPGSPCRTYLCHSDLYCSCSFPFLCPPFSALYFYFTTSRNVLQYFCRYAYYCYIIFYWFRHNCICSNFYIISYFNWS